MSARALALTQGGAGAWLGAIAAGAALGGVVVAGMWLDAWPPLRAAGFDLALSIHQRVGPVWLPMALVAARVLWLTVRAARTRMGKGALGEPVRPELTHLAPLFAALGLAGTVWGLGRAFDALDSGEFLTRLPALLAGLGAAMTSTLVGLGLQIATLLVASFNPAWSLARAVPAGDDYRFELDRVALGTGMEGLARLLEALRARRPEALQVDARRLPRALRRDLLAVLWERTDCEIPVRETGR